MCRLCNTEPRPQPSAFVSCKFWKELKSWPSWICTPAIRLAVEDYKFEKLFHTWCLGRMRCLASIAMPVMRVSLMTPWRQFQHQLAWPHVHPTVVPPLFLLNFRSGSQHCCCLVTLFGQSESSMDTRTTEEIVSHTKIHHYHLQNHFDLGYLFSSCCPLISK